MPSIAIIGDVFYDTYTTLEKDLELFFMDATSYHSITTSLGGYGGNFSLAARQAGFSPVFMVSRVGKDKSGELLQEELKTLGITTYFEYDDKQLTSKSIILYDNFQRRFLIADNAAVKNFTGQALLKNKDLLSVDIVITYASILVNPNAHKAVFDYLKQIKNNTSLIALDVSPHEIYKQVPSNDLIAMICMFDVVFLELWAAQRITNTLLDKIGNMQEEEGSEVCKETASKFGGFKGYIILTEKYPDKQIAYQTIIRHNHIVSRELIVWTKKPGNQSIIQASTLINLISGDYHKKNTGL